MKEVPSDSLPNLPVSFGCGLRALSRASCCCFCSQGGRQESVLFTVALILLPASLPPGFNLIHLVATGVSCFLGSGLLTLAVYLSCQHCQRQSQESTLVHPATPNHLHYKGGGTPKNEKYTPMEFKVGAFLQKKRAG